MKNPLALLLPAMMALGASSPLGLPMLDQQAPAATYTTWQRFSAYAPARDGTQLAVTAYLPKKEGSSPARFPALLWYHPGHRESIDLKTGAIRPTMAPSDIVFFTGQGYAIIIAEMRGSGASFGKRELDRGPQIGRDGKDLVDWIATQGWSDGKVGMIGASYQGFSQYATAAYKPAALKAIFPEIAGFDDYGSMFYPGGILNVALSDSASPNIIRDDLNHYDLAAARPKYPSVPVVDEDGDGELVDEIPLDKNGNGDFLDDGPPRYADGKARQDIYYRATKAHLGNRSLAVPKLAAAPHRDSVIDGTGYSYVEIDPGAKPASIAASGIAVYSRAGWFDYHTRDAALWFGTLSGKTPTRLMFAPTGHNGMPAEGADAITRAGPYFALFGETRSTNEAMNREKLAFFDHYVKGLANRFDARPPVLLYVMGSGWRYEREWPLKRAKALRLSFDASGVLSSGTVTGGTDSYAVDRNANSLSGGANRWNYGISTARKPMSLDGDSGKRLSYATPALARDSEVTGHPLVSITLSSDKPEADIYAYLEDVSPDGSSLLVTEGELRANYHRHRPISGIVEQSAPISVRPNLPWQGFNRADYDPRPFADGRKLTLNFDMQPTAWLFKKGHRIRISIAGADWPSFSRHPLLAGDAVWTVYRGPGLSALTVPVVGGSLSFRVQH